MGEKSSMVHITIRNTANDQQYKLKLPKSSSAENVLVQLRSKLKIPETYVLSFGGMVLSGSTPLEDAGVSDGDILKLIPNPEGGGDKEYSLSLPEGLWMNRLRYEYNMLSEVSKKETVSFEVDESLMNYSITFNGIGLVKDDEGNIREHYEHVVEVELNRKFPYAGGLKIRWVSPKNIFHPNLNPPGVCIDLINRWRPINSIIDVIDGLRWMLQHPNPDDPFKSREDVSQWYKKNWGGIKRGDIVIIPEDSAEIVFE